MCVSQLGEQTFETVIPRHPLCIRSWCKLLYIGENSDCWQVLFTSLFWSTRSMRFDLNNRLETGLLMISNMATSGTWLVIFLAGMNVPASEGKCRRPETMFQKINKPVTGCQYEISSKNHIFSVPAREKLIIWEGSILARGKSGVLPTDPPFRRESDYLSMYPSNRQWSCWQMICNYKTRRQNSSPKCLSTVSHPFPSLSLRFFHPFPKQRACSQAKMVFTDLPKPLNWSGTGLSCGLC